MNLLEAGMDPNLLRLLAKREAEHRRLSGQTPPEESDPNSLTPVQSLGDIPDFAPEERDSLLTSVGRKSLSGLQWIGESLDKPGRAVRGLLGGKPSALLNLIPFSDTIGITDPEQTVSGRDLLEKAGVLSGNTPGLDMGDVAGTALEIATDPLNLLTLGGASVASQTLKNGSKASKALTAASKADEITAGLRPLVSIHTPAFGIPLPSKIPFTNIPLPSLSLPVKELAQVGTGPQAADIYRKLHYSPLSPNPYIRKLFSASEEVTELPVKHQEIADRLYEARIGAQDQAGADAVSMFGLEGKALDSMNKLVDKSYFNQPGGRLGLLADAVAEAANNSPEAAALVQSKLGPNVDWNALKGNPGKLKSVDEIYRKILAAPKEFGDAAATIKEKHDTLLGMISEQAGSTDPLHAKWFDDSLREFVERKDGLGLGDVVAKMSAAGLKPAAEGFDEAAGALYGLSDQMRTLYKSMQSQLKGLGIDVDDLNDYYVGYSHRRPDAPAGTPLFNYLKKRLLKTSSAPFMIARDDVLRNIPLGTVGINQMTRDPYLSGIRGNREAADKLWGGLSDTFTPELSRAPQPGSYLEPIWNLARQEGASYPGMQSFAKDILNEQAQAFASAQSHKKAIHSIFSSVDSDWRKNANAAVKANGDYTNVPKFDEMAQMVADRFGMPSDQTWELMKNWQAPAIARKSGEDVATEALARYRSAAESAKQGLNEGDGFDPDLFDVAKDKTAYPDPSFGKSNLTWSKDNAAFYMANKYGLPAWWNHDSQIRKRIGEGVPGMESLKAAATDTAFSDAKFVDQWWNFEKGRQSSLPIEQQWAANSPDADMFTIDARAAQPELASIPLMSQPDLQDLAMRLYHMPKQVLDEGLFNRGTTTDAVDYMLHATRLKAGVSTARSILRKPGIVGDSSKVGGVPLRDLWAGKDKGGMGLTDEGLQSFAKELFGDGLAPEDLAKKIDQAVVDPEVAGSLTRYVEGFKDPEKVAELMKWVDAGTGLFKGTLTIPYPAFHTRNRLSGIWANWAAGIYHGDGEQAAQDLFAGKLDTPEAEQWLREIKSLDVAAIGRGGAEGQVFDKLDNFRGVGSGVTPLPTGRSNVETIGRYITNPFGELVSDTRAAYQSGGLKGAAKQLLTGGRRADDSTVTDLNPLGMKGALDPLGGMHRGDQVDEFGKPLKGAAKMTAPETTNAFYKAGSNLNDYVEWMNRVGPYVALRKAGWEPAAAARKVRQVQFDYRELSPFERRIMKRIIPFYSFMRKNLEQQSRLLLENPGGRTAQAIRVENNAAREGKGKEGYVPKYLAESFAVRLPGGNDRDAKFFSQSGLLPFEEAFNRFSFDDGLMPVNLQRTGEKFLAQAHPAIQGPLEYVAGKQFWSGRALDDLYQSPTGDQDVNLLLSKLPTARLTNTVGGIFDGRKSAVEKAFNLLIGGAKITDVDPVKQRLLESRDVLEGSLASDPDVAKYTGLYANDVASLIDRYNAGDQEAAKMLKLYQSIAAELKAIKKAEVKPPAP